MTISSLIYIALLLLLLPLQPELHALLDTELLSIYSLVAVIATSTHILGRGSDSWFGIDAIFLLGYLIVGYQWALLLILGDYTPAKFDKALLKFTNVF